MAVTVNYVYPTTAAATTPPTAAQMSKLNMVVAQIAKSADADASATVTHNMALTAAQLAAGLPIINILPLSTQGALTLTTSFVPLVTVLTNSVVITLGTTATTGTAAVQLQVTIQRPFSKNL